MLQPIGIQATDTEDQKDGDKQQKIDDVGAVEDALAERFKMAQYGKIFQQPAGDTLPDLIAGPVDDPQ